MDIRELAVADLDAAFDVRTRSFGPSPYRDEWMRNQEYAIADARVLAAYDGGTVVAMARILPFVQWWGGRSTAMAGIGGVVVAPEYRGLGVSTALMTSVIQLAQERGFAVSMLYPDTVPPYRRVGYELGGARRMIEMNSLAARGLLSRDSERTSVRRAVPGDEQVIVDTLNDVFRADLDHGPFTTEAHDWTAELEDSENFCYLADDGFVWYGLRAGVLQVEQLVARSEQTLRTLWSLVGSGASVAETVRACVGPADPVSWLVTDPRIRVYQEKWWMLRLLDVSAAIRSRGFPDGVTADLPLTLDDSICPANSGSFRLRVSEGRAQLDPADPVGGAVELAARGLAAVFAGVRVATLRRSGLLSGGGSDTDAALAAAFAAQPYATDYF